MKLKVEIYGNLLNIEKLYKVTLEVGNLYNLSIIRTLLKLYDASAPKNQKPIKGVAWSVIAFGLESSLYSLPEAEKIIVGKVKSSYAFPMALGDERGHVYCVDFMRNRFWVVARTGVRVSCLGFSGLRKRELIIGKFGQMFRM